MNIVTITVGWSETCSLPEDNNVKPSITLSAQIGDGEDAESATRALLAECKRVVQGQVDEALEAYGKHPRHYTGPAYQVVENAVRKLVLVIPNEVRLLSAHRQDRRWSHVWGIDRGLSRAGAEPLARRHADERHYTVITIDDIAMARHQVWQGCDSESDQPKGDETLGSMVADGSSIDVG